MESLTTKIQNFLPHKKVDIFGTDSLLHTTFPYYLLPLLTLVAFVGEIQVGFVIIFIGYTLLPLFDEFFSLDVRNPSQEQRRNLEERDFQFKLVLYITIIVDWIFFFKGMRIFSQTQLTNYQNLFKISGFLFIFSNLNAVQIAVAHQIFHKEGSINKYLGTMHLAKNLYTHFPYQHLYGHHRRVATPEDPGTSQKGQSFYQFLPRLFFGSYKCVYQMQVACKKSFFTNYLVLSILSSIVFTLLMFKLYGIQAGILFLIEAFGSIFYFKAINYLEHYGLQRQKKLDGTYEKVTVHHSWDAPHRFSNYLLFKGQRHSDHHENSLKPYQTLVSQEQSPQLTHGYTISILMSFFPETWFRIMDPILEQYENRKKTGIRAEVMKKAIKQTRKFIIKISLFTTAFMFASLIL